MLIFVIIEISNQILFIGQAIIISCHSPNAEITMPKVTSDLLMLAPSFSLVPVLRVAPALSLPARSTRWILLSVSRGSSPSNQAYGEKKKAFTPAPVQVGGSLNRSPGWKSRWRWRGSGCWSHSFLFWLWCGWYCRGWSGPSFHGGCVPHAWTDLHRC